MGLYTNKKRNLANRRELERDELFNEYQKYDYYKENYLKKEKTSNLSTIDDYMKRDKDDFQNKALVRFYRQLPKDIKSDYTSFSDFYDELREIDEDQVEKHRQEKSKVITVRKAE